MTVEKKKNIQAKDKEIVEKVKKMKTPIIAYVNGTCVGQGFTLSLNCDFIIADENARFGYTNINIGQGLRIDELKKFKETVGHQASMYYLLTGELINFSEAKRLNIVIDINEKHHVPSTIYHFVIDVARWVSSKPKLLNSIVKGNYTHTDTEKK